MPALVVVVVLVLVVVVTCWDSLGAMAVNAVNDVHALGNGGVGRWAN